MKSYLKFLLFLCTVLLMSCGDDKKDKDVDRITIGEEGTLKEMDINEESNTTTDTLEADTATSENQEVVEVMLTGNDQMKFNLSEIKVKEGQTVKLTLKHIGQLGKDVMGHNFVLLKKGTDLASFAQKAVEFKSNEYIPEDTDKVITHTDMIGGGQETSITFKAPPAGTYDFICSFPGHYILMQGKLIVE